MAGGTYALEARLKKLEKSITKHAPKARFGIKKNCILTFDGGRNSYSPEGERLGPIPPELLTNSVNCAVIVPEECEIPLPNGGYTSILTWFPDEANGAEKLLICAAHGEIPVECILNGAEPFPMTLCLETGRTLAPWSNWSIEARTIPQWDNYILSPYWLDFINLLESKPLSEYHKKNEQELADVYLKGRHADYQRKKKELINRRDMLEKRCDNMFNGYRNPVPKPNQILVGMDEYIKDGKVVRERRLLIGDRGTSEWRLPDAQDQQVLEDMRREIKEIAHQLKFLKAGFNDEKQALT